MPNLAGTWKPGAPPEEVERLLSEQLKWIRIPGGGFAENRFAGRGYAAAHLDNGILENGPQPARAGESALFLDGEISNRTELYSKHKRLFPRGEPSPPELCLALIEALGSAAAARELAGLYAIAHWNGALSRLTLITDRYGYRPLYLTRENGRLAFGTELKAAAALMDARRPDPRGTLEFFLYGSHFRDLTWLEGCVRLEPATILTADADGVRQEQYWSYRYGGGDKLDQETCFTRFAVLLDRAVERCMRSRSHRIGVFLSGGYDSRSVVAAIRPEHLPISALTFGHPDSRDMRYASLLSSRLGLKHEAVPDAKEYLFRNCHRIIWRTEGMSLFSHTTSIQYHDFIKARMDIMLTGFLGEFSGSHTWPALLLARGRESARGAIHARMTESKLPSVQRIFRKGLLDTALPELRGRFDKSFDSLPNEHPMDLADSFNLQFVQPRLTGQSSSVDRHVLEMRAPHMDRDLVDFLLTIPAQARIEQKIYKKTIAYAFPSIRDVPCTNSGKPIDPWFAREYAKMAGNYLGRKALAPVTKALGIKPDLGRAPRDYAAAFRAEPALRDKLLIPLLREGVFQDSIFDPAGIEAIVGEHYAGKSNHEDALGRLISWGLAVRFFRDRDLREAPAELHEG